MTLEELKKEADRFGYNLVKKSRPDKLLPCKCGHNRREHWHMQHGVKLKCMGCGEEVVGKNMADAMRNWNRKAMAWRIKSTSTEEENTH